MRVTTTSSRAAGISPAPIWCGALELGGGSLPLGPLRAPDGRAYKSARILVRLHGEPLGMLDIALSPAGEFDEGEVYRQILDTFAGRITIHLHSDGLEMVEYLSPDAVPSRDTVPTCSRSVIDPSPVTVVVCTRDRAELMRSCLAGLAALPHPRLEVLVVDNAPSDDSTKRVFDEMVGHIPSFRYLREDRAGLSRARNAGLQAATYEIVAYTDDDVLVDLDWIAGLLRGFRASK
jgi:hypothetical protein